jgi:DNA-directed RNA polymerase specialized sigma24 family protein
MSMKTYNRLVVDMAELLPKEKWFLRLYAFGGLAASDIGEHFDMATVDVLRTLRRARRKYRRCSRWLNIA